MASIQTGIQLQDNFTDALMGIINSVNLGIASMQDMSQAMNADIDTSSIEGAREYINQAAIAAQELEQAMQDVGSNSSIGMPQPVSAPEPVQQPIQWQSDNVEVFSSSGMERYQQEVESTNAMLERLSSTQNEISRQAFDTQVLSPAAQRDMTSLAVRMDNLKNRIQQIENNPINMGTAAANAEMERLRSQLSQSERLQDNLNQAIDEMDISTANAAYLQLSQTISNTERYLRNNVDEQGAFNQTVAACHPHVNQVTKGFSGWQKAIIVANNAIGLVKNTLGHLGVTDMSGAFDRIDTMNRFQKTVSIMTDDTDMANAALAKLKDTTVGTAYGLDVASKATQGFLTRGMGLGAATEQVRIWADAVSFYGEGTNEQLESVVDAVGKMYSKGKVEADQLDRLFDAGIGAAEIYAQATHQSVSKVKDDLSEGEISAVQFIDTVSKALDAGVSSGAAKDAGSTWATTFANMQSAVTRGWTSVIEKLDKALTAHGLPTSMEMVTMFGVKMESTLNAIGDSMEFVVNGAVNAYEMMSAVGNFIADNWGVISPIIYGVIAALAVYAVYLGIVKGIELASAAASGAMAIAKGIQAAAITLATSATWAETTAQLGLNGAMYACPVTWIVIMVIALIAALVALCNWISKTTGITQSGIGIIVGTLMVAAAYVGNYFNSLINGVIDVFTILWNFIAMFANFFANVFTDPIGAAARLFFDFCDCVLATLQAVASAIDTMFGSNLSNTVQDFRDNLQTWVDEKFGSGNEVMATINGSDYHVQRFEYSKAWDTGAKWGDGAVSKVKSMFTSKVSDKADEIDYSRMLADSNNLAATADNTAKIKDAVEITSEDLKYIRDLAEQDYINRFTTAEITVNQTNHNTVNNDMDLDGITEHLRTTMEEQMYAAAEGV